MRTAFGEISMVICKEVDERQDDLQLIKLDEKINDLLVHMKKLTLEMINGNVEELKILDISIEWQEIFNKDGTDHSWFEILDGVKHLRVADKVGDIK